ncbi:MAG: TRIC cation channel family protein [Actinobacteria bacterium]|nr:TRIC cation channel family protein [Actinomycetota bacterium]
MDTVSDEALFVALEVVGTVAFATSGVIAAARAGMDWLGGLVLAVVVAIGGGTMRGVLLGNLPIFWMESVWLVLLAMGTAVVLIAFLQWRPDSDLTRWLPLVVADAVGLSVFAVSGAEIGLIAGISGFNAVLLGVLTGVGGGVLRDILTGQRPMVLVGQIYALAAAAGATVFVVIVELGWQSRWMVLLPLAVTIGLRLLAVARDWQLPRVGRPRRA